MNLEHHLIQLSETPGIPGYEKPVRTILQHAWDGLVDSLETDALGNLLGTKYGNGEGQRRRILITAHMDEIGLMVTRVEDGFIWVTSVGAVDRRVLLSQPVIIHGEKKLPGLIASRPPHVLSMSERKLVPGYDDLVIDTGLSQKQLEKLVPIGTTVSFAQKTAKLGGSLLSGKAMDNRVSCACLTLILHELKNRFHQWDVLVAATVQEETTLAGGTTIAWQTQPDMAIILDTTYGIGVGVGEDNGFKIGNGPTILIGPNAHPKLFTMLTDLASDKEIQLHPEPVARNSGTEAWAIQVSRDGVPCALIMVPIRNMHMPVEVVHLKDIERMARLVVEFITTLDDHSLGRLSLDGD